MEIRDDSTLIRYLGTFDTQDKYRISKSDIFHKCFRYFRIGFVKK